MRMAEASVLFVFLDAAAAKIAKVLQLVQRVDDRGAPVFADRVQAAD